jgi:hypothetical protein
MMSRMRLTRVARAAFLAVVTVVVAATPAAATTVIADAKYKWYYWLSFILMLSFIGLVLQMFGGYIKKVLLPKYRGKRVDE